MSDTDLRLGRLLLPTVTDDLPETLGDQLEASGGVVVPGERRPRPFKATIPVYSDGPDAGALAHQTRRQIRALLDGQPGFLFFRLEHDPDLDSWLLVGGGELKYADGGRDFADYVLELSDAYRVGTPRTHREGRHVSVRDRRLAESPRDLLGRVFSTDFAATVTPTSVVALPAGATDPVRVATGARPAIIGARAAEGGRVPILRGVPHGETVTFENERTAARPAGDVVAYENRQLTVFGHSIPHGAVFTTPGSEFVTLLADRSGASLRNLAVGGSIVIWDKPDAVSNLGGYVQTLQSMKVQAHRTFLPQPGPFLIMDGINDLARVGLAGIPKIMAAERVRLSRIQAGSVDEAETSTAITYTGIWSTITNVLRNSGSGYRQTTANGATAVFAIPASWPGTPIWLLFYVPASNVADVDVSIDGAAATRYSLRAADFCDGGNARGVGRVIRLAPSPTARTVTMAAVNIAGGSSVNLDAVQIEAVQPPPVRLLEQFHIQYAGYTGAAWPFPPTNADIDAMNAAFRSLAAEFRNVETRSIQDAIPLSLIGSLTADGLHPNDPGARRIADLLTPDINEMVEARR